MREETSMQIGPYGKTQFYTLSFRADKNYDAFENMALADLEAIWPHLTGALKTALQLQIIRRDLKIKEEAEALKNNEASNGRDEGPKVNDEIAF